MLTWDHVIKLGYLYLLAMALTSFCLCLKNGRRMITFGDTIYQVYVLIFGLSLVQIRDCIFLLINPVKPGWWVPLICKHASLWVYVLILLCVRSCEFSERETGGDSHV